MCVSGSRARRRFRSAAKLEQKLEKQTSKGLNKSCKVWRRRREEREEEQEQQEEEEQEEAGEEEEEEEEEQEEEQVEEEEDRARRRLGGFGSREGERAGV